jgi:hypothetical protein
MKDEGWDWLVKSNPLLIKITRLQGLKPFCSPLLNAAAEAATRDAYGKSAFQF